MKIVRLIMTVIALGLLTISCAAQAPQTPKEKLSYSLGMDAAKSLKQRNVDLDLDAMIRGIRDGYGNGQAQMTDDEIRATLTAWQADMQRQAEAQAKANAEQAKAEGEAYLASNKGKPGVITLPSGLQYVIITEGMGAKPTLSDIATVHYEGKMLNGTVFDSSLKNGEPVELPISRIIPGLREALQLMPSGSRWRITIPSTLAYQDRKVGPIPPNSVLVFDVDLLSVKPASAAQPQTTAKPKS